MKRILTIALAAMLLLLLPACKEAENGENQVAFYYRAQEFQYDPQFSPLEPEYRNASDFPTWEQALNAYLTGPASTELANPFPAGLALISYQEENGTLRLILSDELSKLTGTELTIACCCIAKTCMEMTGAETISISAETQLLDGERSIILNTENMNLLDTAQ